MVGEIGVTILDVGLAIDGVVLSESVYSELFTLLNLFRSFVLEYDTDTAAHAYGDFIGYIFNTKT